MERGLKMLMQCRVAGGVAFGCGAHDKHHSLPTCFMEGRGQGACLEVKIVETVGIDRYFPAPGSPWTELLGHVFVP